MARRTIFIGDIHGCLEEAKELLDRCEATPKDWVIFLGDLVDRGPDSAGCLDLAMAVEARQGMPSCVLGNHEERHLRYEGLKRPNGKDVDMPDTHRATREQLRPHHYEYMRRMPTFLRVPEHNMAAVHAGAYPGRPLELQTQRHLLHVQAIRPPDERSVWPSKIPPNETGWRYWAELWNGPERLAFGHSVLDRPWVGQHAVGLDGGACFGGELWAFIAPDNVVVSVKGRATKKGWDRKLCPVGNGVNAYA